MFKTQNHKNPKQAPKKGVPKQLWKWFQAHLRTSSKHGSKTKHISIKTTKPVLNSSKQIRKTKSKKAFRKEQKKSKRVSTTFQEVQTSSKTNSKQFTKHMKT